MFNITARQLVDLYNNIVIVNETAKGEYTSLEIQNAVRRKFNHSGDIKEVEVDAIDQQIHPDFMFGQPYFIFDEDNNTEIHIYCDRGNRIDATDKKMWYIRMEPSFKDQNHILSIVADYDTFTFNLPSTDESIETIKDEFQYFFSRIQSLYITTGRMPLVGTDGKRNLSPFDLLRDLFLYSNLGPVYKIKNELMYKTVKDLYNLIIKDQNAVPVIKDPEAAASIITDAMGYFQIL